VEVCVERAAGKLHRAPDMVGPRAAGSLVEEDGGCGPELGQGSSANSCAARSADGPTTVNMAPSAK
jgi:hypothetical protein